MRKKNGLFFVILYPEIVYTIPLSLNTYIESDDMKNIWKQAYSIDGDEKCKLTTEEKKAEENIRKYVKNFAKRKKEKHMLWSTLFHKLGKQQLKYSQHNHVYALLENPKTHQKEKVYLLLKHNAAGHPYFVQDFEKTEDRNHKYERGKKNGRRN